ncbi:hypothetical protein [Methanomethylovorans sp.]|uniref:hypothetical protein n=1 Tax=Methanomethylovorans sp. TaxID=2758717 RepID=UPI00351C305C
MRIAEGASYIPVLNKLMNMTLGPVLELGCGSVSTPYFHWMCYPDKRRLVSYENNPRYFRFVEGFKNDFHEIHCIDDWDSADLRENWSIAFVDHAPAKRRIEEIKRLLHAEYVVAHDDDPYYAYDKILGLFKYHYKFKAEPNTLILSNRRIFDDFTVGYNEKPPPPHEIRLLSDHYMVKAASYASKGRPYTICIALGEIYTQIDDPEMKLKLRYAATIAQYVLWKLKEFSPKWLKEFYPKKIHYNGIIKK